MSLEPSPLVDSLLTWYDEHARELPWRAPTTDAWGVMVSEFMLQQTPVSRVVKPYQAWLERWPTPAALAADSPGEAVRMWGRLGYPRRALRLHASAGAIVAQHSGRVPEDLAQLRALPGVGDYTAAAIAAFGFGQRQVVLDTNVRRVHARLFAGEEFAASAAPSAPEKTRAAEFLHADPPTAATQSIAVMELGALICTANNPGCGRCPVAHSCAWLTLGKPAYEGAARTAQTYAGTDRQCRGRILELLRNTEGSVTQSRIDLVWQPDDQRIRCLESLLTDGLAVRTLTGYALPA